MAANPRNQAYIRSLERQGYSVPEIAESLGNRDSSLLYQVRAGKKPGNNLEPALAELAERGSVPLSGPERRTTATGEAARTRGGYTPTGTGWMFVGGGESDVSRALARAAREGKQVKLKLHVASLTFRGRSRSPASVNLYEKGYDARAVLQGLRGKGAPDVRSGLLALAAERPGVEQLQGFAYVEIVAGQWRDVETVAFGRGMEPSITR